MFGGQKLLIVAEAMHALFVKKKKVCVCKAVGNIYPHFVEQFVRWSDLNQKKTLFDIAARSNKKAVWWCGLTCQGCGMRHEWEADLNHRIRALKENKALNEQKRGCPYCSRVRICKCNSFLNKYPEKASQFVKWKSEKKVTPLDETAPSSADRAIWKCLVGCLTCDTQHVWIASVAARLENGCPWAGCCSCPHYTCACYSVSTLKPDVAKDFVKMVNLEDIQCNMQNLTVGSNKAVEWKCAQRSHPNYVAIVNNRCNSSKSWKGTGCPGCAPMSKGEELINLVLEEIFAEKARLIKRNHAPSAELRFIEKLKFDFVIPLTATGLKKTLYIEYDGGIAQHFPHLYDKQDDVLMQKRVYCDLLKNVWVWRRKEHFFRIPFTCFRKNFKMNKSDATELLKDLLKNCEKAETTHSFYFGTTDSKVYADLKESMSQIVTVHTIFPLVNSKKRKSSMFIE
jgi:hypothetical protein